MGEARRNLVLAGKPVKFTLKLTDVLSVNGLDEVGSVIATITFVVRAAYPQGIDRLNGEKFAAWQELMEERPDGETEITYSQLDWLLDRFLDEKVKVDPGLSQPRLVITKYLERLKKEAQSQEEQVS